MASLEITPEFEDFEQTVNGFIGFDIHRDWLLNVWQGADYDANRATNHVLDTDPSQIRKAGDGPPSSGGVMSGGGDWPAPGGAWPDDGATGDAGGDPSTGKKKKKDKFPKSLGGLANAFSGKRRKDILRKDTKKQEGGGDDAWAGADPFSTQAPAPEWGGGGGDDPFGTQGGAWGAADATGFGASAADWGAADDAAPWGGADGHSGDAFGGAGDAGADAWGGAGVAGADAWGAPHDMGQADGGWGQDSSAFPGSQHSAWDNAQDPNWGGSAPQSQAWGPEASQHDGWNGSVGDYQTQQHNFNEPPSGTVDSESESDEEWWHMPKLKQLLLYNGQQIDQMVSQLFAQHCPTGRAGISELTGLAQQVGQAARVGPKAFHHLNEMVERFDFSGDASLDSTEAAHAIKACLRQYRHMSDPPQGRVRDVKLPHKNLEDEFMVVKKLGQGGHGSLYLVNVRGRQDDMCCVKVYQKVNANAPLDQIKEVFELAWGLSSPFTARIFDIFEDRANVYIVGEPNFGGDLLKLVSAASEAGASITEDWFRGVFLQPVQGVQYMNQQRLMHCDIKETNIIVANDSTWQQPHVMLKDFCLAANFAGDTHGVCGTPGYIAPETWQNGYWVPKGDVFSLGVVFFQVMSGLEGLFSKYMGAHKSEDIYQATCSAGPPWHVFDHQPDFREVVAGMLEKDPASRPTIIQTEQHYWFRNLTGAPVNPEVIQYIWQSNHSNESEMQVAELMLDRFDVRSLHHLSQSFHAMDQTMSGVITADQAGHAVSNVSGQLGMSPGEIDQLVSGLADCNGNIHYKKFMSALIHQQKGFSTQDLWTRFCQIDTDRNGVLDQRELMEVVKYMNYSEEDAWSLMNSLDKDMDGRVTFEEFKQAILGEN